MDEKEKINVLLIEDEAGDAGLVQISLRESKGSSFNVVWIRSLTEAKTKFNDSEFDVLLLDLSLPDSTGLDTLKSAIQIVKHTPIIVLTGQNNIDFALLALKQGASDYLVKGDFSDDSLERVIRYTLHRAEMEEKNHLLIAALEAAANGIVITDRNAIIKWANPAFSRVTGYSLDEAIGNKPSELVKSGLQDPYFYEKMWDTLLSGQVWRGEVINRRKDGSLYHEELSIAPVTNHEGEIEYFVGVKEDISLRKQMEEQLQRLANTDPLTGLYNRRVFLTRLEEEHARVSRLEQHPAALLMMDLDYFKRINDNHGHGIGDNVLQSVAAILRNTVRKIDLPARLGGEEFAVLLPGTDKKGALVIAERLRAEIENCSIKYQHEDKTVEVSFTSSVGVAILSKHDESFEKVLHRADAALYQAKAQGRNQCCWFMSTEENE